MSKPILPQGKYKYFRGTTNFTNDTGHWVVVVGIADGAIVLTGESITSKAPDGGTVDSFSLRTYGVAADTLVDGLPRRMLVVPGGTFNASNAAGFIGIECISLEDALAIL